MSKRSSRAQKKGETTDQIIGGAFQDDNNFNSNLFVLEDPTSQIE